MSARVAAIDHVKAYLNAVGPLNLVGQGPSDSIIREAAPLLDTQSLNALRKAITNKTRVCGEYISNRTTNEHQSVKTLETCLYDSSKKGSNSIDVDRVIRIKLFASGDVAGVVCTNGGVIDETAVEARIILERWMDLLRQRCKKKGKSPSHILRKVFPRRAKMLIRCINASREFGEVGKPSSSTRDSVSNHSTIRNEHNDDDEHSEDDSQESVVDDDVDDERGKYIEDSLHNVERNDIQQVSLDRDANIWQVASMVKSVLKLEDSSFTDCNRRRKPKPIDREVIAELDGSRVGPISRQEARARREVSLISSNELQIARVTTLPLQWLRQHVGNALTSQLDRQLVNAFVCEYLATLVQIAHLVRDRFAQWFVHPYERQSGNRLESPVPLEVWELRQAQRLVVTLKLCGISCNSHE